MKRELMREAFSKDIRRYKQLEPRLREWIADAQLDLSELRRRIFEYILYFIPNDDDDNIEALCLSFSAVDGLIEHLEISEVNCWRLKLYIQKYDSYEAFGY